MKLKDSIVVDSVCGEYVAVPTGKSRRLFSGMIRNNETAHFIYQMLCKDTSEEELVAAVLREYEVDTDTARRDIRSIIGQLRQVGFLDE